MDADNMIILMDKEGNSKEYKVSQICPYPFDKNDL